MSKSEIANLYADVIISDKLSIREVARLFDVSKSTVHTYISKYVTGKDRKVSLRAQLEANLADWYLKGGAATKSKYSKLNKKN